MAAAGTGSVVTPPALVIVDVAAGCVALLIAAGAPVITSAVGAAGAAVATIIGLLTREVCLEMSARLGAAVRLHKQRVLPTAEALP